MKVGELRCSEKNTLRFSNLVFYKERMETLAVEESGKKVSFSRLIFRLVSIGPYERRYCPISGSILRLVLPGNAALMHGCATILEIK